MSYKAIFTQLCNQVKQDASVLKDKGATHATNIKNRAKKAYIAFTEDDTALIKHPTTTRTITVSVKENN